jgi:two-component system cell cycle sensor histidine kinase/response regulator CckA
VQPLVVNDLVADITNLLLTAIGTECTIGYHLAGSLPLVEADAAQLRQVVMNLIVNASDAIGAREGRIDVTTTVWDADRALLDTYQQGEELPPGRYVEIRVADTGSGMSPETIARIFDPFFTTKFTGRGLGLAAVLGIVRGHRGALRVTSALGAGTTFSVLLPAASDVKQPIASTRAPRRVKGAGRTILLVDDNLALRDSAQRILERSDFRVLLAGDGVAALDVIQSATVPIALVLSDISMPRMGGSELWARIRQDGNAVPLLLTSGYSEEESLADMSDDPQTGFVQKPFTIDQLLGAVSALLPSETP